ncbi:MAG: biotin--[acetyl-CoA-carboxylase] ligase [Rickettsiaceae bacterium]|nr:biotin--[acetyl-CoA-carboxylase] ligase [Rickettsiaceae bacterium]
MIDACKFKIIDLDEIDSTNNQAKRLLSDGEIAPFVIIAKNQTAGRGRYSREWKSADGNLYMSIVMQSTDFVEKQHELSFVSAIALHNVLQVITSDLYIKWPNDIITSSLPKAAQGLNYEEYAKVAGILLESVKYFGQNYLIIGIGVNVNSSPFVEGREVACLSGINPSAKLSTKDLFDSIVMEFSFYYNLWFRTGFSQIRKLWLDRAFGIGATITVSDRTKSFSGVFLDIDHSGAIVIEDSCGKIIRLSTGEIFFGGGDE